MDAIIVARLDIVAAKAKILSEKYKNNQLWQGELDSGVKELQSELNQISQRGYSSQFDDWNGHR